MRIRAVTCGLSLDFNDFLSYDSLRLKVTQIKVILERVSEALRLESYEVQTVRLSLNSFEYWLPLTDAGTYDLNEAKERVQLLVKLLSELQIQFCSIGCARTEASIRLIPHLLALSPILYANALIQNGEDIVSSDLALIAAEVVVEMSKLTADGLKNFSYCVSFNCQPNIPFFPASYHQNLSPPIVTIALECGELLFIAFHGVTDPQVAIHNLHSAYTQMLTPIQTIVQNSCQSLNVIYGGIDGSMNPGLSIVESVGQGIEQLHPHRIGSWGTLQTVSVITKSIKSLSPPLILCGYSGLMLPVMEDVHLAARAMETPSPYSLQDLLLYSSVCGVGLDTVPVPGTTTPQQLRDIYLEIGTLAQRLKKPLSCRLLLMPELQAGDMTNVSSPYLCNTRVFSIDK